MKHCEQVLRHMNWKLLREQKAYCLNESNNNKDVEEVYDGLVHLIDALQDAAIIDGIATENEVFGTSDVYIAPFRAPASPDEEGIDN